MAPLEHISDGLLVQATLLDFNPLGLRGHRFGNRHPQHTIGHLGRDAVGINCLGERELTGYFAVDPLFVPTLASW